MNQLYCPFIWKELVIENDGFVSPCLFGTNKLTNTNLKHNGKKVNLASDKVDLHLDDLVKMRQQMLQGQWPTQCVNCRARESKNLISHRQKSLKRYNCQDATLSYNEPVELKHLTFRVGNICNLRCVMCGPWASNQWYNDYVELNNSTRFESNQNTYYLEKKKDNKYFMPNATLNADNWENVIEIVKSNINDLEKISFHGGEPLVSKIHYKVMDFLVKSKQYSNIEIEYFTNLYQVPANFFTVVDLFKHVTINVSLDGVENVNDAVRWPSKYSNIIKNIKALDKKTNVTICFGHTISNLNLEHIFDFIKAHCSKEINLNFVKEPIYTSLKILDKKDLNDLKDLLKQKNIKLYNQYNLDALIESAIAIPANSADIEKHRKIFIKMWDQFSKKQEQNWQDLFPFMYSLYSKWKHNEKV